jgi:hypothetical protein
VPSGGGRELRALAIALKKAGDKPMGQRLRRRLTAATDDFAARAKAAFVQAMPQRGGYQAVLEASFRVTVSVRAGSADARVSAIGYADGTKERRDLPRLEKGVLRHPVFGRSRKLSAGSRAGTSIANPWATTKVSANMWAQTTDKTWVKVNQQMRAVVDELAAEIMGG